MADYTSSTLSPFQRLMRLLGQYRREIRYILLYSVVAGLINLSLPLGIQAIIGLLAGGSISASWGVLVFFVILGALFTGLLRVMQLSMMEHMQRRLFTSSALEFALRLPRLNQERLRREHLPELINRFFDTINLQKGLPKLLIEGSTAILNILFSLILLSFYHPTFVTFSLLLIGGLSVLFYWTGPRGLQTSLTESKYKYRLAYWLEEVGRVSSTFKLAGDNHLPLERTDELTSHYLDARGRHWRILVTQFVSGLAFRVLVLGGFLVLGSLLVMGNELNIGQFVASEILILFVVESMEKLVLLHETGYDVLTSTEKLGQVTDLPLEREGGIRVEEFCSNKALQVELRNLTYQFDDASTPTLHNLNLLIPAGQRIAVAGYSGAGKSTLMQLLSALKLDFQGALLYNGLPIQNLNLRSLRRHIGDFSSQEDLFKGSILENITLGDPSIPLTRVLEVAEALGLSAFIQEQPGGIQTELLPGGKNLPGSIVSKVLVARAVVGNPELLVLEDPLNGLNLRDRLRIANYLINPQQPWTLVCSTVDPLLASLCNRVLVLREGEIVFDGSYDDAAQTEHSQRVFTKWSDSE